MGNLFADWEDEEDDDNDEIIHIPTGISELDHVLGGGIVISSLNFVHGEKGCGKSSLLDRVATFQNQFNDVDVTWLQTEGSKYNTREQRADQQISGGKQVKHICKQCRTSNDLRHIVQEMQRRLKKANSTDLPILIVDTATALWAQRSNDALDTLRYLRTLQTDYNLTLILTGHTFLNGNVKLGNNVTLTADVILRLTGAAKFDNLGLDTLTENKFGPRMRLALDTSSITGPVPKALSSHCRPATEQHLHVAPPIPAEL